MKCRLAFNSGLAASTSRVLGTCGLPLSRLKARAPALGEEPAKLKPNALNKL